MTFTKCHFLPYVLRRTFVKKPEEYKGQNKNNDLYKKFAGYLQPETPPIRFTRMRTALRTGLGENIMPDDFIRRMIRAVVESFPIDETKKEDMLWSIAGRKHGGGVTKDVLCFL